MRMETVTMVLYGGIAVGGIMLVLLSMAVWRARRERGR